ncbi:MAG: PilZ domain-containing protein [Acidobacteriota bacterium]
MADEGKPQDPRRNPRFDVENLDGRLAFNLGAEVVNISPAGMCVRTTSPLVVHRSYDISLSQSGEQIRLKGTVRWCTLRSTRRTQSNEIEPLYEAGVAFDGLLTEAAVPLLDFLRNNVVLNLSEEDSVGNRLFGRFEVRDSEVELTDRDSFEIRRLSLSGMLARSPSYLPRHTRCKLQFDVDGGTFRSNARIVHSSQVDDQEEPVFDMGVEFLEMTTEGLELLRNFIRERFGG